MSEYDHCAEAKIIADRIEAGGFEGQAADIRNAIDAGVFATETLMEIRFFLNPMVGATSFDELTRTRIKILIGKINTAVGA